MGVRSPKMSSTNSTKSQRHQNQPGASTPHASYFGGDTTSTANQSACDSKHAQDKQIKSYESNTDTVNPGSQKDNTVVHKEKNGTITVQSSKKVGGANYSFVSVSPT